MKSHLSLHFGKIGALLFALSLIGAANIGLGKPKNFQEVSWIDILGEGSTLGLMLMFLSFVLISRPRGRVTNLLVYGLIGFCAANFQDMLDEIIRLPTALLFDDIIESMLAPLAVMTLGYGFFQWNQEQVSINKNLQCRERFYREHSALDYVTDLYTALYMKQQIDRELVLYQSDLQPLSILVIDIENFGDFNRRYGLEDGDRLLAQTAKIITLNLRASDLACRYAGDRFIVLFPATHLIDAQVYSAEIVNALKNFAFKPSNAVRSEFVDCNMSLIDHRFGNDAESLLRSANNRLELEKRKSHESKAA